MSDGALTTYTAPADEPLTLAEAKAHLRVTTDDEDTLIASLIVVAREHVEEITGLAFITRTLEYALNAFPRKTERNPLGAIWLPRPPLQSVTSITYTDTDGATQTLSAALYSVDARSMPGQIVPAYGESWPGTRAVLNAVVVRYVAGYGAEETDAKESFRHAMRVAVNTLFEHREDFVVGATVSRTDAVRNLLCSHRMYWI